MMRGTGAGYAIEFPCSGTTFDCGADEPSLTQPFRNGLDPPSSWAEGVCGTYKILICCSTPREDLIIAV